LGQKRFDGQVVKGSFVARHDDDSLDPLYLGTKLCPKTAAIALSVNATGLAGVPWQLLCLLVTRDARQQRQYRQLL